MVLEAMFWIDKQYGDLERCSFVFLNFEDFMIGLSSHTFSTTNFLDFLDTLSFH